MRSYCYLLVLFFTILVPFAASFESRLTFYKRWKPFMQAALPVGILFILWDIWFTSMGVWSFNEEYIIGVKIFNLPLEECLFFFLVPYSCLFIYEVLNWFFVDDFMPKSARSFTLILASVLLLVGVLFFSRIYTFVTFVLLAALLFYLASKNYQKLLGNFYRAFLVTLIPFLLVNGILTAMPVVLYDRSEQLNVLIYTIPMEDAFYGMLLLLLIIWLYEIRKNHYLKYEKKN